MIFLIIYYCFELVYVNVINPLKIIYEKLLPSRVLK